jgi:hypothetical protein
MGEILGADFRRVQEGSQMKEGEEAKRYTP